MPRSRGRRTNFLLGFGERLVEPLPPPPIVPNKSHPYSLSEAAARLQGPALEIAGAMGALPDIACPADQAVALFTLHPAYLAKSYFPRHLMEAAGFDVLGTRSRTMIPVVSGRAARAGQPQLTTDLYVAGTRRAFRSFADTMETWPAAAARARAAERDARGRLPREAALIDHAALDLVKLEDLRLQPAADRIRPFTSDRDVSTLEVVLHARTDAAEILEGFEAFARTLDLRVDLDDRLHAEGLCFLALRASRAQARALADFSFLRVVREMPRLRQLDPSIRVAGRRTPVPVALPDAAPVDASLRVAVFDGGLPAGHPLGRWVRTIDLPGIGPATQKATRHGLQVTSALLFGPITPGEVPTAPYAPVDHYRVVDAASDDDADELLPVLQRILGVLRDRPYEFVSLSVGPALAIDDDEVHVWTAMLDTVFSRGRVLATVAVGNTGQQDRASGNARIQTPADCVNALAVGAADSSATPWGRAPYSSVGPGRCPGVVKPDVLAFGGSAQEPFYVVDPSATRAAPMVIANAGTSFAAPSVLRTGLAIRSTFGPVLKPVALKALLIHGCDPTDGLEDGDRAECGWGRVPTEIESLVMSDDSTARIVYQSELGPGEWKRMAIPFPKQGVAGMVELTATFCFLAATDPQDPMSYTRSGLEVRFRPHADRRESETSRDAKTKSFFQLGQLYLSERQLRDDAHKWEPTLHRSARFRGTSLHHPVFDVHYNARVGGRDQKAQSEPIPYALVLTVRASKEPKLYNRLVQQYRVQLEPLLPQIQVPIRTRGS